MIAEGCAALAHAGLLDDPAGRMTFVEILRDFLCALLERPEMEVRRVAELLGYSDPANFTRAFRQWTGRAPREWRSLD